MKSTVEKIMTTRVVAVHRSASYKEMAVRLRRERVSAFPVVDDDGTVVGVVSETDLLPKETLDAGWAAGIPEMTSRVLDEGDQEKAESVTAAELMTEPAVTAAPEDTVEHAARQNVILNELRTDPEPFTVTAENGIVTLEGAPETADLGRAIAARARHVEGVVAVRDRLKYPPS